jgi:hypothetical protein
MDTQTFPTQAHLNQAKKNLGIPLSEFHELSFREITRISDELDRLYPDESAQARKNSNSKRATPELLHPNHPDYAKYAKKIQERKNKSAQVGQSATGEPPNHPAAF